MSEVKEYTLDDVIKEMKKHNRKIDTKLISRAYDLAKSQHEGQLRKSGEPYIIHPVQVAYILATLGLDDSTICAALLHDVVEDTNITKKDIIEKFGEEIANMVDGVTKLSKLEYATIEEQQVENYRKMFLAMGKDIRVILIKLSDRLHNMRTLKFLSRDRQIANARETMVLYAPLANRLGMYSLKWELEDLSFKYLYPEEYRELVEGINKKREERLKFIDQIMEQIKTALKKQKIEGEVTGRAKHLYSIYNKMKRDNITLDQVYDLFALRIIVNSVKDCYAALGVVHELYNPMPGRFKDYISVPKPNMYQSLHTTLIGPKGTPFEVQIRTWDMHRIAEYGIAAHWAYKEASYFGKKQSVKVEEDKLAWLRESLEWQKDMQDPQEFLDTLKTELFEDEVYVFTPKGAIKVLPRNATPIDFAYSIHEEIGNHMTGCKINSKMMPIITPLKSGDIIEIITSDNSKGPSRDWLKFVKSTKAKNKINGWFKKSEKAENIEKGKDLIEKEIKRIGIAHADLFKQEYIDAMLDKYKYKNIDEFFDVIHDEPLDKWYEIGNVIAIADAGLPEQMSKDAEYLLGSEAADAGLVFVSKLDESSKEQADTILPHINRAMEAISCTRKLSEEDVMKKKWGELTNDDWNRILTCGYHTESWQKRDVEDDKSFSSLSFMNLPLTKEQILNAATQILGDPSCGHVHRIKGFLETPDGWFELNATAAQRQLNPIANGQQIIIVIGEGLNKEKIEAYL